MTAGASCAFETKLAAAVQGGRHFKIALALYAPLQAALRAVGAPIDFNPTSTYVRAALQYVPDISMCALLLRECMSPILSHEPLFSLTGRCVASGALQAAAPPLPPL